MEYKCIFLQRRQGDGSAPAIDPLKKVDVKMDESESEFCIDAGSYGNVTRFINHSCQPNLFVQCILSTHHDIRLARIVLFAADDILPMQVKFHLCFSSIHFGFDVFWVFFLDICYKLLFFPHVNLVL